MEYKKDLLRNNDKSTFVLILGIALIVISILLIVAKLADNELIRLWDWFSSGIFILLGLTNIFRGLGTSVERFLGKAFVHIDNEMIDMKLGAFEKEFKIDWEEIKSIECKSGDFTIQKLDNSSIFFPISKLDYSSITEIKNIISKLAERKDISYNIYQLAENKQGTAHNRVDGSASSQLTECASPTTVRTGGLRRAKTILRNNQFTAPYDKGYHTGSELAIADALGIQAIVAIPSFSGASHAPDLEYDVEHFQYYPETDTYTCLQGHTLTTTGYWHQAKNNAGEVSYRFRNYTTPRCKNCPVRPRCTKSAANGKQVRRSEFAASIENNKRRVHCSKKLYKRQQAITEHPFGTIKRQWGYNYIITKKYMNRAEADCSLVLAAYNLRRIINLLGAEAFGTSKRIFESLFDLINWSYGLFSKLTGNFIMKTNNYNYFQIAA